MFNSIKATFSHREIVKAHRNNKTLFSFQYIEGKNGKYVCEGSLVQTADFISGALAKILVQSDITPEEVPDFCKTLSETVQNMYKEHKVV